MIAQADEEQAPDALERGAGARTGIAGHHLTFTAAAEVAHQVAQPLVGGQGSATMTSCTVRGDHRAGLLHGAEDGEPGGRPAPLGGSSSR